MSQGRFKRKRPTDNWSGTKGEEKENAPGGQLHPDNRHAANKKRKG